MPANLHHSNSSYEALNLWVTTKLQHNLDFLCDAGIIAFDKHRLIFS